MKTKLTLLVLFVLMCGTSVSQNKIEISKIYSTPPVVITKPFMTDSTNLKGEKFDDKQLLETNYIVKEADFKEEFTSDTSNTIFFKKANDGSELRYFSFTLNADRYGKVKITVTSPGMLELYVNNKKETTKTSLEDSINLAKKAEKEITVYPGTTELTIKYLSKASNKVPQESLKILAEAKDSLLNLSEYGTKKFLSITDVMEGTKTGGGSISANGRFAILSYTDVANGGNVTRYNELYDTKTGRKSYLDKPLYWMPTSNKLYYVAQRGDKNSLITVDPETFSEEILFANIPKGSFRFSPNEQFLIYTDKESYEDRKGDLLILKSPTDRWDGYYDKYFLYKYDLALGIKQRLTYGRNTTYINDISPDSRYMLFSTSAENITERPFRKTSLFMMDLQTLAVDTIWFEQKFANSASFSPDGKKLLISGGPEAFNGIGQNVPQGQIPNSYDTQAFIMDLSTKQVEAISKDFDPSINRMVWISGKDVYMIVTEADYENVYKYNVSTKKYTKLNINEDVIRSFSIAKNGLTAVYSGVSVSNSTKAYIYDVKTAKSALISDPSKDKYSQITLGEVKDWNFTASDGTVVNGRFYLPPNFTPTKKYPMIVYYYGGTTPTPRILESSYPLHVYASLGYVVYTLQPSGTTGFGQEFSARHVNAWGKRTADEIIEGTKKFVAEHPFVNADKIGCVGASYGGFMTMYLQTVTDIFAAAVSHAGISSIASYWGEGYWGYSYSAAASAESYPWNNKELYVEQSPLFNADKINTPLLLLHGMEDTNVPVGESVQMYTALKILGRPVEFIRVKGENHGIATYKRRIEWNHSIFAWFAKWLHDDSTWWDSMYPEK